MKYILLSLFLLISCFSGAQCTQNPTYDLTVTGTDTIHPTGQVYNWGLVCTGGHLIDSALCCTRFIFIDSAGHYEAGPGAYGMVYLKNGGIFDAHGNTMFFNVYYETGATILNYTGNTNLCTSVVFPAGNCSTASISDRSDNENSNVFPNPCNQLFKLNIPVQTGEAIVIYKTTGEICLTQELRSNEVNVSALTPGIYLYQMKNASGVILNGKFIVSR